MLLVVYRLGGLRWGEWEGVVEVLGEWARRWEAVVLCFVVVRVNEGKGGVDVALGRLENSGRVGDVGWSEEMEG